MGKFTKRKKRLKFALSVYKEYLQLIDNPEELRKEAECMKYEAEILKHPSNLFIINPEMTIDEYISAVIALKEELQLLVNNIQKSLC